MNARRTLFATTLATIVLLSTLAPTAIAQEPTPSGHTACNELDGAALPPLPPTGIGAADNATGIAADMAAIILGIAGPICHAMVSAVENPEDACRIIIGDSTPACFIVDDLLDVAEAFVDTLQGLCGLFIEGSLWHSACLIAMDPNRLESVLQNIISLALEVEGRAQTLVVATFDLIDEILSSMLGALNDVVNHVQHYMSDLVGFLAWVIEFVIVIVTFPAGM